MTSKIVLSITDIASNGKGIAKHNGKVYFVSGAFPMQTVEARIIQEKDRFTLCDAITLLDDSHTHRPSLCPHTECGGCALRFIPYEEQCLYKQQILQNTFVKIAKNNDVLYHPISAMEEPRHFRTKAEFHYGLSATGKPDIGFYASQSHTVIPVSQCAVIPADMLAILDIARTFLKNNTIPVYHNNSGFWRYLVLRYSVTNKQYMIHCITTPIPSYYSAVQSLFHAIVEQFPSALCVHSIRKSKYQLAQGESYITKNNTDFLSEILTLHNTKTMLDYGPNCFFQNNYAMMQQLYSAIHSYNLPHATIADICAGVGSIGLSAFKNAKKYVGFDYEGESIEFARKNALSNDIDAHYFAMDMKHCPTHFLDDIDILCVDPPRSGLDSALIQAIKNSSAQRIIYVSCNPSTMARDCSLLQKEFLIRESTLFDMFPHTVHCESLTLLERIT